MEGSPGLGWKLRGDGCESKRGEGCAVTMAAMMGTHTHTHRERERVCDEATTARRGRLLGLLLLGPLVNEGDRATIHLAVRRRRRRRRRCVLAVRTKHAAPC